MSEAQAKKRKRHCSHRVRITLVGDRHGEIVRRTGVTAEESAKDKQIASQDFRRDVKRRLAELNARREEDSVRIGAPGGLKATDATYTVDDELQRQYLESELGNDNMHVWDNAAYGSDPEWESEYDDDAGEEDVMEAVAMEKDAAVTELRLKRQQERNRFHNRFRTQAQSRRWREIYEALQHAFMAWEAFGTPTAGDNCERSSKVLCISWEGRETLSLPHEQGKSLAEVMVRHGFMPTAPVHPSLGISLRVLATYDVLSRRCPSLSVMGFTHGWCDYQGIAFENHFGHSFSRAFDAYLEIRHRIGQLLEARLYDSDLAAFQDICPACTRPTDMEPEMKPAMLVTMDGNESLKRVKRQKEVQGNDGKTSTVNIERPDDRHRTSRHVVEADEVDLMRNEVDKPSRKPGPDEQGDADQASPVDGLRATTTCADKWTNLSPDHKNTWGTFHESGVFVCACRHGCVLLRCDMICSGELAKYPLALVNRLIDLFGKGITCGYDIGCGFSTTANKSPRLGHKVREHEFNFCCGSFHGYAHNRACQLQWHPLYIPGVGIEDFEGCERIFSETNRAAAATRNASKFHRQQWLDRVFERLNNDKHGESSKFILENYKQAAAMLEELRPELAAAKQRLGIESNEVFEEMRQQELEFLVNRQNKVLSSTEQRELQYLQTLQRVEKIRATSAARHAELCQLVHESRGRAKTTQKQQTKIQRLEKQQIDAAAEDELLSRQVRYLEDVLNVSMRWQPGTENYTRVSKFLDEEAYYKAMDRLEGLVIARLFELSKMNKAGTGVRMRVQIAKALQTRSKAITSAVAKFNAAGRKLGRDPVNVKSILQYASLGEFDLLRLSRHHVREKPWAQQAFRDAQTIYFKVQRAEEEVTRVSVEAKRLLAYVMDWVRQQEQLQSELHAENAMLAFQHRRRIRLRLAHCGRHLDRLHEFERLGGCLGEWTDICSNEDLQRIRQSLASLSILGELTSQEKRRFQDDSDEQQSMEDAAEHDDVMGILSSMTDGDEPASGWKATGRLSESSDDET